MSQRAEEIDRMIEKLRLAWHNFPQQRLCQLVWNAAFETGKIHNQDSFHVPDSDFEIILNRLMRKHGSLGRKENQQ